jgi:hypothetical protein
MKILLESPEGGCLTALIFTDIDTETILRLLNLCYFTLQPIPTLRNRPIAATTRRVAEGNLNRTGTAIGHSEDAPTTWNQNRRSSTTAIKATIIIL